MDFTNGSNREPIDAALAQALRDAGSLIEDTRLERTRWFDGRFLAARDLVREQQYFLTREAHLGRAAGSGVATGLQVSRGGDARTLRIAQGHGLTPAGELVLVDRDIAVNLADIPRAEQLSGKFGLGRIPVPPLRSRSGLFALALRPVEFTANPVGSYPTSISGPRTVEDGDVIEATAVVLVPWADHAEGTLDQRRGQVARDIFVRGDTRGVASNLLPLAMVALEDNTVAWIDAPMLRRELGADRADLPGLGLAPRALRFAHLLQHQQQLAEVLADNGNRPFAAAAVFPALPPAGPLPPGVIDPADFTQRYFPAEVDVDFAIIPEDELPALVEEALALPGLDLGADEATLDASAVVILAPVPRSQWRAVQARLRTLTRALRPASPNRIAARKPLEILQRLRLPGTITQVPAEGDGEWQRLARLDTLWFVRRRNLAYREDTTGTARRLAGRELIDEALKSRIAELGLKATLDAAMARATPAARGEITQLLATPRIAASPALLAAGIGALSRTATLDQDATLTLGAELTAPHVGAGFARLEAAGLMDTPEAVKAIANSEDWRAVDLDARVASPDALGRFELHGGAVVRPRPVPAPVVRPTPPPLRPMPPIVQPVAGPVVDAPAPTPAPTPARPTRPVIPTPVKPVKPVKPVAPVKPIAPVTRAAPATSASRKSVATPATKAAATATKAKAATTKAATGTTARAAAKKATPAKQAVGKQAVGKQTVGKQTGTTTATTRATARTPAAKRPKPST